jgi:hypothetical protein
MNAERYKGSSSILLYSVPRNTEPTYWRATAVFCVVTDSFSGSLLAAAAAFCRDGFRLKLDTVKDTSIIWFLE